MGYSKIYRGEFSNTLENAATTVPVDQRVRIDISDTSTGTTTDSMVGSIIVMGGSALNFAPPKLIPDRPLAERTAFWQTYADFFFVGMNVRVTGSSASDGDYIITSILEVPPTNIPADGPGSLDMTISPTTPGTSLGEHDITFENITTPTIIPLEMDGDPLHISTIDNDEDKFTPIRSKQAQIRVNTSNSIDINTFCEGTDDQFLVDIYVDDLLIFIGYLMIPDIQQEFLPDPNVLVLTATDNIPALKDNPAVDEDGKNLSGKYTLIELISMGLKKTGILANINVINNIQHGSGVFSADAAFSASGHSIALNQSLISKFYNGQKITISGTASNNGTFTVIGFAIFTGILIVVVSETIVDEATATATITDVSSSLHFYEVVYLDAKTFEKDISVSEDFYSILQKILLEDSVLFQCKGEWYIVRIDEIGDYLGIFQMNVAVFNSDGEYQSTALKTFSKDVSINNEMAFMDEDAIIIPDRGKKFVKETYRYDIPIEIICNIDFSRGDFIEDVDPTDDEKTDGAVTAKSFELDDWTLMRGYPDAPGSPIANDSTVYIKRTYNVVDYESARYLVMTPPSVANEASPYVMSCDLPVKAKDRFEANIEFRLPSNPTFNFFAPVFQIVLHGVSGEWYLLNLTEDNGGDDALGPRWIDTNGWTSETSLADYHFITSGTGSTDYTKAQSINYDFKHVPPVPEDGKLYILLHALNTSDEDSTDNIDIFYSGLSFTYYPYINGSYQKYTGQYHQVSQIANNKSGRDKEVKMSDSPRQLFKGAMLVFNGVDFVLAGLFIDHNHTEGKPYGEIQAFAVWNQYRVSARNFEGTVDKLDSAATLDGEYDGIDLLHKINLKDSHGASNNRYFMTIHYDQDFNLLENKTYFASLYRTDLGKTYTDEHIFKYITN
jgi:hypothetical protein